jgi:polar amino acid transport system substrate-binding protein
MFSKAGLRAIGARSATVAGSTESEALLAVGRIGAAWRAVFVAAVALAAPVVSRAAEPAVPYFWDPSERMAKPDLAQLPRLRFLTTIDYPPFNYLDASGKLSGFHVDFARAICAELGLLDRCEIQALPWAELPKALRDGQGEAILGGLAINAGTRAEFAFSRPYLQFPARFAVSRQSVLEEPLAASLAGKKVGVVAGSAHEEMLRDCFSGFEIATFPTEEELYAGLTEKRIDAAFGDGMRIAFWLAGTASASCCRFAGGPYLAPEYFGSGLAIAVRPDAPELAAAFDHAMREIESRGTFGELYLRYFPLSFY